MPASNLFTASIRGLHYAAFVVPPDASGGGLSAVDWGAALAPVGAWPALESVTPVLERRLTRATRHGAMRELVVVGAHDPLGLLSAADAVAELSELARPLRAARPLRSASRADHDRLVTPNFTFAAELGRLDSGLPEGPAALAPIFAQLIDGLAAIAGPVAISLLASPATCPHDDQPRHDDGEGGAKRVPIRHLHFGLRILSSRPLPATLLARAEALCLATRARDNDWHVAMRPAELAAARAAVAQLRPLSPSRAGTRSDIAALTLALPTPVKEKGGQAVGRPISRRLPATGPVLGRVPRPDGRQAAWRLGWDVRRGHVFVTGRSGCGKTTAVLRMILDDIEIGRTVVLIDPHGDLADLVASITPRACLVHIDPRRGDTAGLDLLDPDPGRAAAHLLSAASEVWPTDFAGPAWQRGMSLGCRCLHATTALCRRPTLADLERFFVDAEWRSGLIKGVEDRRLRVELAREHDNWLRPSRDDASMVNWLSSKLTPLTQGPGSAMFDTPVIAPLEDEIATGSVIVVALPVGTLGSSTTSLVARMLLTRLTAAIAAQGDVPEDERHPVSVYVDEAHVATGDALAGLFAQARKFNCALTVACQLPSQLQPHLEDVLTNAQTHFYGRLSQREALLLGERVGPQGVHALTRLPKYHLVAALEDDDPDVAPMILTPVPPPELLAPAETIEPGPVVVAEDEVDLVENASSFDDVLAEVLSLEGLERES